MSEVPFGHHTLQNRYCFTGMLTLDTPLRVSSGRASDETDAPLMRDRAHIPYIPGSSLRGAIRSELERILAAVGDVAGVSGCVLFTDDECNAKAREFQKQDPSEEKLATFAETELCDLCRLLGCTVYASRLTIEDAYPGSQIVSYCRVRDGVGIDRDTGAAREGVKFDYEVLEKGPEFSFSMRAENVTPPKDKTLINLILGVLKQGLYVGGKRAAGLGKVKLKNYTVAGFADPKALWEAIMQGKDPHQTIAW